MPGELRALFERPVVRVDHRKERCGKKHRVTGSRSSSATGARPKPRQATHQAFGFFPKQNRYADEI